MQDNRPNPEEILKRIQEDEENESTNSAKGRLKIFLGFCAGVGKTYHMLEETRVANGVDAVIGVVETHKREETEALLEGLTIIPKKKSNITDSRWVIYRFNKTNSYHRNSKDYWNHLRIL